MHRTWTTLTQLLYDHGPLSERHDPWSPDPGTGADRVVAIRRATADDWRTLGRLAALDSAKPLTGDVLLAVVDGETWAALSLDDGRAVADPFRPSAHAVELLRLRSQHLRAAAPQRPAPRRLPLLRRAAG
ncbi:hypothetical protein [Conexibacter sp. SYSU D00693]|uniref:hypothetical protein n=1 Tax=Conexibacter sp. SYSU D00693 TaxID=2812560 RepID=UPI00196A8C13|nr:hypothetical protein [Conexibacter sp. SYSU D00693]